LALPSGNTIQGKVDNHLPPYQTHLYEIHMKIDIHQAPPQDIYHGRKSYLLWFLLFLLLFCCGIAVVLYAMQPQAKHIDTLETVALVLFSIPSLFVAYFGSKLQAYKKLTPPQLATLADLSQKHPEIARYCQQLVDSGREPVRAEFNACENWAEKHEHEQEKIGPAPHDK
jgi:hypothetical protein